MGNLTTIYCFFSKMWGLDGIIKITNKDEKNNDWNNVVLSCSDCNFTRSNIENKLLAGKSLSLELMIKKNNFDEKFPKTAENHWDKLVIINE